MNIFDNQHQKYFVCVHFDRTWCTRFCFVSFEETMVAWRPMFYLWHKEWVTISERLSVFPCCFHHMTWRLFLSTYLYIIFLSLRRHYITRPWMAFVCSTVHCSLLFYNRRKDSIFFTVLLYALSRDTWIQASSDSTRRCLLYTSRCV